jgi:hypothetical protein
MSFPIVHYDRSCRRGRMPNGIFSRLLGVPKDCKLEQASGKWNDLGWPVMYLSSHPFFIRISLISGGVRVHMGRYRSRFSIAVRVQASHRAMLLHPAVGAIR